ncbi:hypothetical protein V2A60_010310 [Cordyceps javanica]|uniref:C6 zinc finger domain-containing protein n=1 Tax=Cordyceps javanica TaxID=43265 RepID=A0A545UUW9_9HYPO|nr:C6 zinc finger domain-containing protein [Cordyceps javanica]TQW05384.1 C6 zinc finger domain-containing protein [Cordyceps javanica]
MHDGGLAGNVPLPQAASSTRRKRRPVSCDECRRSKLRCDRQQPCSACKRRGREGDCGYEPPARKRPSSASSSAQNTPIRCRDLRAPAVCPARAATDIVTEKNSPADISPLQREETLPTTDRTSLHAQWETVLERPTPEYEAQDAFSPLSIAPRMSLEEIMDNLPARSSCDHLISHFFDYIFPLFPILHGPTFQKQYRAFARHPRQETDLSWLALLFSLCSLALSTMDESDPRLLSFAPDVTPGHPVTVSASRRLLRTAMACLLRDDFFVRHKFSTFEALLMVIYSFSHNETVHQGWALLGMALNIGIALRCNMDKKNLGPVETERRRRCWAGLLTLHTYQGILFRDVDFSYLLTIKSSLPANVNDADITEQGIQQPCSGGGYSQMSVMMCKVRLFRLSTHICQHISGPSQFQPDLLRRFDAAVAAEQEQWDATFMVDGSPSVLDSTSYAYWCVLQTYAHHLYLLIHRPFHHSKTASFRPASRERCISSSRDLLSIHKQIYEEPLLRNYLWLLSGVTSLKALHAAVALHSCLQDPKSTDDDASELETCREDIDGLARRMQALSGRSNICARAHRILTHLQSQASAGNVAPKSPGIQFDTFLEDWAQMKEWIDTDMMCWNPAGGFA